MNEEIKNEVIININISDYGDFIKSKISGSVSANAIFLMKAIIESQKLLYEFYEKRNEPNTEKGGKNGN